jgi:hypothetical protein
MEYASVRRIESRSLPGVSFGIHRMSLGRRIELTREIHGLSRKIEFLEAGGKPQEQIEAAWLANEIDGAYLKWGLASVEGLAIDGEPATPEMAALKGPEELCREMLEAIRAETTLGEAERKN